MLWCNGSTDVLQVTSKDPGTLEQVIEGAQEIAEVRDVLSDSTTALSMIRTCACDGIDVNGIASQNGCWAVGAGHYLDGWESHRALASRRADLQRFMDALRAHGEVELASLRYREEGAAFQELGMVPVPLFGGLTEKQISVLVSAHESGLLSIPARTKMDTVAKRMGMSRSTYGEHLRKAMQTIVENSYPVLKLYVRPSGPRAWNCCDCCDPSEHID